MYGPEDDDSKFTTHVIKSCLRNVPELKLTAGEQKRDFIHIDDVVSAYFLLLQTAHEQPSLFQAYGLGSGKATSIRESVEMVHRLTQSEAVLKFGALPYREYEIMESKANIEPLRALGWESKISLDEGIQAVIRNVNRGVERGKRVEK